MRWKSEVPSKHGNKRVITRFLFWPKYLNGEYRFLELAQIRQEYISRSVLSRKTLSIVSAEMCGWQDVEWINL